MTTFYDEPRGVPLRDVFSPEDYDDVRRRLQRGRWWRLLNAKDRLLALARRAGRTVADLTARAVGRFRLEGAAVTASTRWGRALLGAAARTSVTGAVAVGRPAARVLARLGARGERVLAWLRQTRHRIGVGLARVSVHPVAGVTLANWRLLVDLLGTWARERVLGGLLARFLPRRYSLLIRLTLGALLVPGRLRHTVPDLARQLLRRQGRTTRTHDRVDNPVRPEEPTDDTTDTTAATPASTTTDTTTSGRSGGSAVQHEPVERTAAAATGTPAEPSVEADPPPRRHGGHGRGAASGPVVR